MAFILKVDLAKAFDRLEWHFIASALRRLGFREHFIHLINACITTPTFSILVNGEPSTPFTSQRGLRQGQQPCRNHFGTWLPAHTLSYVCR